MSPRQMSQRTIDRINSIGPQAAALITDAVECRLIRQFRQRTLELPPGRHIAKGWRDICEFVTASTSLPYGSDDVDDGVGEAHSHLTILCIQVIADLSKAGWLEQRHSAWPEVEYVRTDKPAPGPRRLGHGIDSKALLCTDAVREVEAVREFAESVGAQCTITPEFKQRQKFEQAPPESLATKFESTIGIALAYLERNPGRFLFPIRPLAKMPPLIRRNLAEASNDPVQLRAWHRRWSGCNWGCALAKSNVIVVDVDSKAGKQGQQTYDWLDILYGWPDTESIRTPSGGRHYYYEGPHSFALGKSGFGEDVDSPNYTLIPGCVLNDGARYEYLTDHPPAPAMPWMLALLQKKRRAPLISDVNEPVIELDQQCNVLWAIEYLQHEAPPSIAGRGGEFTVLKIAMTLRDYGISFERSVELINEHFNTDEHCQPTWDGDELAAKIRNAYTYANRSKIGAATAEVDFAADPPPEINYSITPIRRRRIDKRRLAASIRAAALNRR